jgi:hypothetical protein
MADIRRSVIFDALARLGFKPHPWDGMQELDGVRMNAGPQVVYRHDPSDTFFPFPVNGRPTLPPHLVRTIRDITVGRGAATERAFDAALAAAESAANAIPARKRTRSRPKPVRVG